MKGRVTKLLEEKRFGFIKCDGVEYFFHKDDFTGHWNDLAEDFINIGPIEVEFEITDSAKGPRAAQVKRLDWPNQAV